MVFEVVWGRGATAGRCGFLDGVAWRRGYALAGGLCFNADEELAGRVAGATGGVHCDVGIVGDAATEAIGIRGIRLPCNCWYPMVLRVESVPVLTPGGASPCPYGSDARRGARWGWCLDGNHLCDGLGVRYSWRVQRTSSWQRSPTKALLLGLIITLAVIVAYSAYITVQIAGLRQLQSDMVDRNRKDSLQLLRLQNDLNSVALAMRDMLDAGEPYPLVAWSAQFDRLRGDLDAALRLEEQY